MSKKEMGERIPTKTQTPAMANFDKNAPEIMDKITKLLQMNFVIILLDETQAMISSTIPPEDIEGVLTGMAREAKNTQDFLKFKGSKNNVKN